MAKFTWEQRDKAQQQLEQVTQKITEKDEQFQKLLILSVKAGVNLEITEQTQTSN